MTEWYCKSCDAGPWSEGTLGSDGSPIVKLHRDLGCKIVEDKDKPKLRGKKHWGYTEIEKEFTNSMIKHYDELLDIVIHSHKGSKKSSLIRRSL